jgi:CDP-ribitol ribitolphosphotransferase
LSHPKAVDAVDALDARRVTVEAISWERIQVTIRLRPIDGRPLDPDAIRLVRRSAGDRITLVSPTRAWLDGPAVVVRDNVMQGPGQDPLVPGTWAVMEVGPASTRRPRPLVVPAEADPLLAAASTSFDLSRGRYSVRPARRASDGALTLVIELREGPPAAAATTASGPVDDGDAAPVEPDSAAATPGPWLLRRLRRLRPWTFVVLYRLARLVARRNGRRILFTSDSRGELGGNLEIVHDRMVERGLDRDLELQTLFKPGITARRPLLDRLRLPWVLARADAIVLDDYQPVIYRLRATDTRIVQLWHAWGAFKTVGYSRVGKPGGLSPWSRVHKNYTHAIVSSSSEVAFYAEAFGIPEARVYPTGIPRMDRFWDPGRAAASRAATLAAYPAAVGRRVFLFAPTFRGHGAKTATYDLDRLDLPALHDLCVELDAACIIRMHPFVRTPLDIPDALADRIIDGAISSIDINDVLFATDLLITDYSSVVYEFSTMDRPMLFFAYDLDEYVASRDFYVRYEDFVPGRIVRTFPALLDAIRREDYAIERLAAFRATNLDHFDGRATDRVIDLIIGA